MAVDDRASDGVLDRIPEPDAGSAVVKRVAVLSVLSLTVAAAAVVWNELRQAARLLADAINPGGRT